MQFLFREWQCCCGIGNVCAKCLDFASYIAILCGFVYSMGKKEEKKSNVLDKFEFNFNTSTVD